MKKKRILSLVMVFCLVLSLCSVTAFADDDGAGTSLPDANEDGVITLTSDVTITSLADLFDNEEGSGGSAITIDLAGKTLTLNASAALTLTKGQSLSFVDSTADGSATEGTLAAGTMKLTGRTGTYAFFNPEAGASVSASDISVESTGSVFLPKGSAASVTVNNCNVKTTGVYCVGTNAATQENYGVKITLKDSVLTADASDNDDCAVLINVDGTLNVDNCIITGNRQAVVVRAGEATIRDSELIVTGAWIDAQTDDKDSRVTGAWSDGNKVASSALTVGNYVNGAATSYAKNATVTLTDTTVTSQTLAPAIYVDANQSYTGTLTVSGDNTAVTGAVTTGQYTSGEGATAQATITVEGGHFSESVAAEYLDSSLTAELISSTDADTPYSYYTSVDDAKEAAGVDDVVIDLTTENPVQIVAVGFKADGDKANEAATALGKLMGAPDTWAGITDCDKNTMYVGILGNGTDTSGTTYKMVVTLGTNTVYETENTTTAGSIVYFTFEQNGGSPAKKAIASGVYKVTLTEATDSETTEGTEALATATIALSQVSFDLTGGGALADEDGNDITPAATYYAAGSTIELPTPTRSGSYRFNGWSDGKGTYTDTYTVPGYGEDITLTDSWTSNGGGSGSSGRTISVTDADNGKVTVSPSSASKNTTVTITVTPDDGYELDDLTAVDANGNELELTKVSSTKYTFTMPASKVTVTATFAESEGKTTDAEETEGLFTDVSAGAYYYDAVQWAVDEEITTGTTSTTFSPNASCTRAQMVTFLWRAAGSPEPTATANPFADVSAGAYYYDAVLWAVEQGITNGTTDTTFSPDVTVTRSQTVTLLYRYAGTPEITGSNAFADVAAEAYYANAVQWAVDGEVTNGTSDTTFSPNDDCTRAQIVTMLYRYMAD